MTSQTRHANADLPLPNVYFATVVDGISSKTHHLYLAADFSGAAIRKLQNICAERFGFRPYPSNSVIKLRRFRLQDYLDTPSALQEALVTAHQLGERDTLEALVKRPQEVRDALAASRTWKPAEEPTPQPIDAAALMAALGAALREAEAL